MDLKGITWVGNIYQKFEAFCMEVEETVCQDTVKYVEDQLQTFGVSVKNFYSDVVQDLLPPSVKDSVKMGASDLLLKKYADTRITKKPKIYSREDVMKVDSDKKTDDRSIAHVVKHVDHVSSTCGLRCVNRMLPPSSGDLANVACSGLNSWRKNDGGICTPKNSNLDIKEDPKKLDCHASQISDAITPVAKDLTRPSSYCELPSERQAVFEQRDVIPRSDSDENLGCDSKEEKSSSGENLTSGVSIELPSFDVRSSSYSGCMRTESYDMSPHRGVVSATEHLVNEDTLLNESANMVDFKPAFDIGSSDGWNLDPFENNDVIEEGIQAIEVPDKAKLDETCVLVDGDKLFSIPPREGKQKSYKKMLRYAFSSKMKSTRKHEYEKLIMQHGDIDADSDLEGAKPRSGTKDLQNQDLNETEWELL